MHMCGSTAVPFPLCVVLRVGVLWSLFRLRLEKQRNIGQDVKVAVQ